MNFTPLFRGLALHPYRYHRHTNWICSDDGYLGDEIQVQSRVIDDVRLCHRAYGPSIQDSV